ncbi:MAG: alpha/beta hydrolase [Magnetospirillum sp.]|nr:alpha/beta hydrolase [Magnetospirillum sp.]
MSDVYLHPEMAAILAGGGAAPDYPNMPLAEARTTFERLAANWNSAIPALCESRDLEIPAAGGFVRARLLRPTLELNRPVIVFVHGGGWTFGSIDTHRGSMARLAIESGACVLGIDYRRAPEHPYPAAIDDTLDALDAVRAGLLGDAVDPSRIGLAGDSAGAGISLGVLTAARGRNRLRAAALFYGCYAPVFDTPSHAAFGGGAYLLTTARMRWYWANWRGPTPLPDLAGLPPLYLNAAGLDPLRDESFEFARVLGEAGNDVRFDLFAGVCHGFMQMSAKLEPARTAHRAAGRFFAEKLQ